MTEDTSRSPRGDEVLSWLAQQGHPVEDLTELPGDVSPRRYLRLATADGSAIVAIYPPSLQTACHNFLETTRLLSQVGVRVPRVLASDCERGLTLLEDVGSETLYDLRDHDPAALSAHFWHAAADIERIQSLAAEEVATLNPALDKDLLWRELRQTLTLLFEPHGLISAPDFSGALVQALQETCRLLDEEPAVPCHRDFMSRNFVPVDPHPVLAVLDHQDLRLGPRHYDLASLLNDSLFPSAGLEEEILLDCLGTDPAERARYHRAAAQRTLKAIGTYESFAQRGSPRHRRLIPATLDRALRHLAQLPEAAAIAGEIEERMAPLLIC